MSQQTTSNRGAGVSGKRGSAGKGPWRIYAVGAAVCAGVTAGAYVLGVEPAMAKQQAHQADVAELESRRKKAADLHAELGAARRTLTDTQREVEELPLRLDSASTVNRRLARLADVALESGLNLDELQPGTPVDAPHYQTVPLRLVGTGSYTACATFLHELRKQFPDTAAKSFDSSNPNPARDQATGTFRFELVWYTSPAHK